MTLRTDQYQIGLDSTTDTNNFLLQTNGTGNLHLHRGSDGSGPVVLRVKPDNTVEFPLGQSAVGYATGQGGTVTQLTNKGTNVTLNKITGRITTNNASLAAGTTVGFNLLNTNISTTDTIVVSMLDQGANYNIWVGFVSAGACSIYIRNMTGGSLSDAIGINFSVIKGAIA